MAEKKPQIVLIHGGMTFKTKKDYLRFLKTRTVSVEKSASWSGEYLDKQLGRTYEIIRPRMPLVENAQYEEWKIHFERYIPHLRSGVILIGVSLGGIFLAKYLSEHKLPKKIQGVFLVCPPFDETDTVPGDDLAGGFKLKSGLSRLDESTKNLYLFFSKDDQVVPVSHAEKYARALKKSHILIFKSKGGHFRVAKLPEIVKLIRSL
jgi:predicted alpha/beta hydrolase family esterase